MSATISILKQKARDIRESLVFTAGIGVVSVEGVSLMQKAFDHFSLGGPQRLMETAPMSIATGAAILGVGIGNCYKGDHSYRNGSHVFKAALAGLAVNIPFFPSSSPYLIAFTAAATGLCLRRMARQENSDKPDLSGPR